jgi:hypothetical protein
MLTEYINKALGKALYDKLVDGTYSGKILLLKEIENGIKKLHSLEQAFLSMKTTNPCNY